MQTTIPTHHIQAVITGRALRRALGWNELRTDHWEQELDAGDKRRQDGERLLETILGSC